MKKLGGAVNELLAALGGGVEDSSHKARRAASVKVMWQNAVEAVYKDAAEMVLDHVNAVYIMAAADVDDVRAADRVTDGGTVLVVYSDDSLIRSDLDARQEFLKMKINEQGEHVEAFLIKPSRFDMKARHPFRRDTDDQGVLDVTKTLHPLPLPPLTPEEYNRIAEIAAPVDNAAVRRALEKAVAADWQQKMAHNIKNNQ